VRFFFSPHPSALIPSSQGWGKGFLLYPFTDACAEDGRHSGMAAVFIIAECGFWIAD